MAVATPRPPLPPLPPRGPFSAGAFERGTARACDALLLSGLLAFASWTLAYHACLLIDLGVRWALVVLAVSAVPCAVSAVRSVWARAAPAPDVGGRDGPGRPASALACGLALAAAAALAAGSWSWPLVWALWVAAAAAAVIASARGPLVPAGCTRPASPVALAWAAALAVLSLFLLRPDADDAYYLRQAAWIAEHGRFPHGDTLHSHDALPAVFSPPLPSYEPLLGVAAAVARVSAPALAHLLVAPAVSALAVLALWRLLRTWEVRLAGPALTVALVFLLTTVEPAGPPGDGLAHLPGSFFVARAWQGKVILVAVLVPVLFSLLHEHAARPRARTLALLAASGVAGVGLSTTATFLVPAVAVACLAPLAVRDLRRAAAGVAAACAYPAAATAAALLSGGRQPARWKPHEIAPEALVLPAVGTGAVALVAMTAALAGPLLLTPRHARRGTAAAALAAALLFAPGVPQLVYELTGLGRPLWRVMWAMPVAALVGVVATQPAARLRGALRVLPALAVCAGLALAGTPVWEGRLTQLASEPALKRKPEQLAIARAISRRARPGDLVLAPAQLSQTLLMLDGRLIVVSPRLFYTRALPATPAVQRRERRRLFRFANRRMRWSPAGALRVRAALRAVDVDIACVRLPAARALRLLARAGFRPLLGLRGVWCGRHGPSVTVVSPASAASASSSRVAPEPLNPPRTPGSRKTAWAPPGATTRRSG